MAWYWWVLIAVAVLAVGIAKIKLFGTIREKMAESRKKEEDAADED